MLFRARVMAEAEPLAQRPIDVRPQEALNEARREVPIQNAPAVVPVQIPPPAVVPAAAPPVQNPGAQVVAPPLEVLSFALLSCFAI